MGHQCHNSANTRIMNRVTCHIPDALPLSSSWPSECGLLCYFWNLGCLLLSEITPARRSRHPCLKLDSELDSEFNSLASIYKWQYLSIHSMGKPFLGFRSSFHLNNPYDIRQAIWALLWNRPEYLICSFVERITLASCLSSHSMHSWGLSSSSQNCSSVDKGEVNMATQDTDVFVTVHVRKCEYQIRD